MYLTTKPKISVWIGQKTTLLDQSQKWVRTPFPEGSNDRKESNSDRSRPKLLVQWSIWLISITVFTWFGPKQMSGSINMKNVIFRILEMTDTCSGDPTSIVPHLFSNPEQLEIPRGHIPISHVPQRFGVDRSRNNLVGTTKLHQKTSFLDYTSYCKATT